VTRLTLVFGDDTGQAIESSDLPLDAPDLSELSLATSRIAFLDTVARRQFSVYGVITSIEAVPYSPDVQKRLVRGPLSPTGNPIAVDIAENDHGGIRVGRHRTQRYEFEYLLEAPEEGPDWRIFDRVTEIFDPDPDAEDGVLDGIVSEPCADGACDGISVLEGQCSAKITRNKNDRKLESHEIRIRLDAGFDCRVSVWVKTSQTPFTVKRPNRRPEYEPTKCTVVKALASGSIYDTVSLDEGHKVYEVVQRIRILGPDNSLQLTPNHCDK
jgi:hypothetical protein